MRVFERKPGKNESVAFTFPQVEAQLTEDVIKTYSLGPALKRIGRALARQHDRRQKGSDEVIGVDLRSLGFNLLLAKKKRGR